MLVRSLFVFVLLAWAGPARCCEWSLGTHLGLASISSGVQGSGSSTVIGWPSNALVYQPGLRLGCGTSRHGHELFVDSGQYYVDEAGSSLHLLLYQLGYQYVLAARGATSLFGNVSMGRCSEGGAVTTVQSGTCGAGLGLRHVLRADHGALRGEVRLDRLDRATALGRPKLQTVGLRLGFDLWL